MSTYVLVHGAWHGSWCWKRVRKALQARGHEVFTPALTGVGERSHLLSRQVNLDTHIDDVVNLIQWEELSDVVLCGHSYGGAVISGVAERIPDRIGALVYLDAFVLKNGQCLHDTLPPEQRNLQMELTATHGEGWKVPPIPAEVFHVNANDAAWVESPVHHAAAGHVPTTHPTEREGRRDQECHLHPGHRFRRFSVPAVLRAGESQGLEDADHGMRA